MSKIRRLFFAVLVLWGMTAVAQTQDFSPRQIRLRQHIEYLASDELRGREAGTDDALQAAQYIIGQYQEAGLKPLFQNWLVPFQPPQSNYSSLLGDQLGAQVDGIMNSMSDGKSFHNVVAVIEGSDPALRGEIILIGAHYDHLGVKNGKVYNGADDNASGSACVIEMARMLSERRGELKRTIVICAFDGEELGLYGSKALARQLEQQKNVKLMMSIDMVGWYKQSGRLTLEGTATLESCSSHAQELAREKGLNVKCKKVETSMFTATDTEPFAKQGIPTLAITTGVKSPYHQPEDDADLIDYEGLDRIVDYLSQLTLDLAQEPTLAPTGRLALKHGGREPLFSLGLSAGLNHMSFDFTDAAFSTKSRLGWQTGLPMRFQLRPFVVQTGLFYEHGRSMMPELYTDPASASCSMKENVATHALTIPAMVFFNSTAKLPNIDILIGGGVYYSILLNEVTCSRLMAQNPFGVRIGYEMKIGHLAWGLSGSWQMNNFLGSSAAPKVKGYMSQFNLTYYFW